MTGLEVILFLFSSAVAFVGGIVGFVAHAERHKSLVVRDVQQRCPLLEQRSGNVDRPFGVTVAVHADDGDLVVAVDAVVRGDHALWHGRADVGVKGTVVVVDADWHGAVRAARGLALVRQLTPRFAVYADDDGRALADALVARRADVCSVVVGAKAVVVDDGAVFVEVARDGLDAEDALAVVARVVAARDVVEGRAVAVGAAKDVDSGSGGPAGMPFAVPYPRFA